MDNIKQKIMIGVIDNILDRNKTTSFQLKLFNSPAVGIGFQSILSKIDKTKYDICYDSVENINQYDYALFSLVSYYDLYNFYIMMHKTKTKTKIIIGGPAVLNIFPFIDKIYMACFGRFDYDINDLLDGKRYENVYNADDGLRNYVIGQAKVRHGDNREFESVIGCKRKCYFCEYSWRYKYVSFEEQYDEYRNFETMFKDVNFINRGVSTTGIDGLSEGERKAVNKPLSNQEIIDKLEQHTTRNNYRLKLYSICAYPFTSGYDYGELLYTLSKAKTNKMTIMIGLSHFCPMPLTPMEEEKILICELKRLKPTMINNIKIMTYLQSTSYKKATLNALFNRCREKDNIDSVITKNMDKTINLVMAKLPHIIDGGYIPVPYISRTYNLSKHKKKYKKNIEIYRSNCEK